MAKQGRFTRAVVEEFRKAKIIGVRSGDEHRYTGVWVVVVEDRVFVRSWNDKPTGWFRAFRKEREGKVKLGDREIRVRAVLPRSVRVLDAVTTAYPEKYNTKGSRKWATGFAEPLRVKTTFELIPR